MLSDVSIVRQQGLGKTAVRQDGIAGLVADGVALPNKVALETPFVVTSLSEAESLGITEQYDKTNKVLLWHHRAARRCTSFWLPSRRRWSIRSTCRTVQPGSC